MGDASDASSANDSDAASDGDSEAAEHSPILVADNVSGEQNERTLTFVRRDSLDDLLSTCYFLGASIADIVIYVDTTSDNASDTAAHLPTVNPKYISGEHKTTLSVVRRDSLERLLSTCYLSCTVQF